MVGALLKEYDRKNVFFIHALGGDEDISLIHFKKHYRMNYPMIPDNLDRYRHIIRVTGISNVAVFDGDGVCVLNKPMMADDVKGFMKVIDDAVKKAGRANRKKSAYVENGTVYAPDVKKEDGRIVHERMPRLAAGSEGAMHLVYVSDESGSNDIVLRSFAGGRWGKEIAVAASKADEYAPAIAAAGPDEAVIAYVGEAKDRYEIFVVNVDGTKPGKPKQVTRSADDAMAPSICSGNGKELWLAWYEWAMMGDVSRDREVFVARHNGKSWSKPAQVSPKDVPGYEDHGEPVVRGDREGGAWVAWTWDYHGTLRSKPPVDENSIFMRHVDRKMKMGEILAAGFRGEGRARDYVPTLAVGPDSTPWVAWDNSHKSSMGNSAKAVFLNRLSGSDFEEQTEVAAHRGQIDTPCLVVDTEGAMHLVWGQQTSSGWELMRRQVGPQTVGKAGEIKVKGESPRYPSACFDSEGKLWVAYTDTASAKWKVRAEKVD